MNIWCETCCKTWYYPCPECALGFVVYHRDTFDHTVTITPENKPIRQRTHASTARLLGGR